MRGTERHAGTETVADEATSAGVTTAEAVSRLRALPFRNELAFLAVVLLAAPVVLPESLPAGIYGLGLVSGALLALQGIAVVLVYRSSRIINFAQVQIGIVAAVLFSSLVNHRPAFRWVESVCPPCVENVGSGWLQFNYWASLVLSLAVAGLLGWLTYVLVVKRFLHASPLVLTLATVFLAQALTAVPDRLVQFLTTEEQRQAGIRIGAEAPLPFDFSLRLGGTTFHAAEILTLVVAALAVAGIAAYLRFSATGMAIRATSEHRDRAEHLGIDADVVTSRVWVLAGLLSGLVALMTTVSASSSGTEGSGSVESLVRILAVAVVARFSSVPVAAAAGLAIGVLDQSVIWSFGTSQPFDGALVLLIGGLLLLQRPLLRRADREDVSGWESMKEIKVVPPRLAAVEEVRRWRRLGAAGLALAVLALPWLMSPSTNNLLGSVLVFAMVGMSLLVLMGWAGQISLGQFGFAAVGAYAAAVSGLPFFLALGVAAVAGAAVAVVVGLPALKLRGLHLAVSTLALSLAATAVLLNPRYLGGRLPDALDRPVILGMDLDDQRIFYYAALAALGLVVLAVMGLRRSRTARVLIAARDNGQAAQSFGVSVVRARLGAFALSGALAAFAGGLFAYHQHGVAPAAFAPEQSIEVFMMTVIGGLGAVYGPLLGAAYLGVLVVFSGSPLVMAFGQGVGGLLLLMFIPGGLAGLVASVRDALLRRVAVRRGIAAPSLFGRTADDAAGARAPIAPKLRPGGATAFVPARYRLEGQWSPDGDELVRTSDG